MVNVDNKNKKAKMIGAIALSAVLVSGLGYGGFKTLQTDEVTEEKRDEAIDQDNDNQDDPSIEFEKDEDGDFVFEVNEKEERNLDHLEGIVQREAEEFVMESRSLDHLEDIVLAQAKEDGAGRNLDHLEGIVLAQAIEGQAENQFARNEEGLLVFDGNEDKKSGGLLASIDENISIGSEKPTDPEEPTDPVDPKPEEPTDPVDPKPEEPTDPVNPVDPKPEIPTDPIDPVDPKPEEPTVPIEPEKPTDPEPVITTDISYKTDYLGFKVERIEDPTLEKGKEKVVQKGVSGSRTTKYKVTYEDGKEVERIVLNINEELPINKVIHVGTKDIDELESLINNADGLVGDNYTEETWNVLLEKLDSAKSVLFDKDSSQKQVDLAKDQLENAIAGLIETEEPTDPVDPEEPTDPIDPEEPTDPVDPEEPTDPVEPEELEIDESVIEE